MSYDPDRFGQSGVYYVKTLPLPSIFERIYIFFMCVCVSVSVCIWPREVLNQTIVMQMVTPFPNNLDPWQ